MRRGKNDWFASVFSHRCARIAAFAALLVVMLMLNLATALAQVQSHRLSETRVIDQNLNMGSYQINTSRLNATTGYFTGNATVGDSLYVKGGATSLSGIAIPFSVGDGSNAVSALFNASNYGLFVIIDNQSVVTANSGTAVRAVNSMASGQSKVTAGLVSWDDTAGTGWAGVRATYKAAGGDIYGFLAGNGSYAVYGDVGNNPDAYAGYFVGNVNVSKNLTVGSGSDYLCLNGDCRDAWPAGGGGGASAGWNASGGYVYLNNTGDSVGIGTTTPSQKLHVAGNATVVNAMSIDGGSTSLVYPISLGVGNGTGNISLFAQSAILGIGASISDTYAGAGGPIPPLAVFGRATNSTGSEIVRGGLALYETDTGWAGVMASYMNVTGTKPRVLLATRNYAVYATVNESDSSAYAGYFKGKVNITGNLTVGTGTVFIDGTNNRIGVGTTTPTAGLDVRSSNTSIYALSENPTQDVTAVYAYANTSKFKGTATGVYVRSFANDSGNVIGVDVAVNGSGGSNYAIRARTNASITVDIATSAGYGVDATGTRYGVRGLGLEAGINGYGSPSGVYGQGTWTGVNGTGSIYGVYGQATDSAGYGVYGKAATTDDYGYLGLKSIGVYGNGSIYAGYFAGNVKVTGNITSGTGTVFIDGTNSRVGIGTTAPDAALEVNITSGGGAVIGNDGASATGDYAVAFGEDVNASGKHSFAAGYGSEASGIQNTIAMGAWSIANFTDAIAIGDNAVAAAHAAIAIGDGVEAYGVNAVAIGYLNDASGQYSVALGPQAEANNTAAVSIGAGSMAYGQYSLSAGQATIASGDYSVATGFQTNATGDVASSFGSLTVASGIASTAFGYQTLAGGANSFATGAWSVAAADYSTAIGYSTNASGDYSVATGYGSIAKGSRAVAMGDGTYSGGSASFAAGMGTNATGTAAFASGYYSKAIQEYATAMGYYTNASGWYSTALGWGTRAENNVATAIGYSTKALGLYSTAMGSYTSAEGDASTSMGELTNASGQHATAMGYKTNASGNDAVSMGSYTNAQGQYSTAMGRYAQVTGDYSFAWGDDYCTGTNCVNNQQGVFAIYGGLCVAGTNACPAISNGDIRYEGGASAYDLAEGFPSAHQLEKGDVVVAIGDLEIGRTSKPFDTRVVGIVSTSPNIVFNFDGVGNEYSSIGGLSDFNIPEDLAPLTLAGRTPVKVTDENGAIAPGDLLTTSSKPGYAMKWSLVEFTGTETAAELAAKLNENERRRNSILGKALEPLDGEEGKIMALVTLQ